MKNKSLEDYKVINHHSGLELHLIPKKPPYNTTYCEVVVPFGGLFVNYLNNQKNTTSIPGIAHFFEHKIFASSKGDRFEMLTNLGASANAYTTYTRTAYVFSAINNQTKLLKEVLNMIQNPYFTPENVKQEADIIVEEANMYANNVNHLINQTLINNVFHVHPIRNEILGSISDINNITVEDLQTIHKRFYQLPKIKIVMAGRIDEEEIIKMLDDNFTTNNISNITKLVIPFEPPTTRVQKAEMRAQVLSDKVLLVAKLPVVDSFEQEFRFKTIYQFLILLTFGKSSKNREILLNQQQINNTFYAGVMYESNANIIIINGETTNPEKLSNDLLFMLLNIDITGLESDFERIKRSAIGNFIFELNDLEDKVFTYCDFLERGMNMYDALDIIKTITFDEVMDAIKHIKKENISELIVRPK